MEAKEYQKLVQANTPARPILKNALWAFFIGGLICVIGEVFFNVAQTIESHKTGSAAITLAGMIFIGVVLTAFGIYDEIAEKAGAGAAVPITGFANTVASAAIEFRREGFLQGMGAKMFVIAGPVIVFGILFGFIVALVKSLVTGVL